MAQTQAEVEAQAERLAESLDAGNGGIPEAFRAANRWQVELGQRTAMLNPDNLRWYWFNRVNSSWEPAGVGLREGILVCFEKLAGVVEVPDHERSIGEWYLYYHLDDWHGPVLVGDLQNMLANRRLAADTPVFSAGMVTVKKLEESLPDHGASLADQTRAKRFCTSCGGKLTEGAKFCSYCGKAVE